MVVQKDICCREIQTRVLDLFCSSLSPHIALIKLSENTLVSMEIGSSEPFALYLYPQRHRMLLIILYKR